LQEVAEALIEEAEIYSGNKKHLHALTIFFKAINVCEKYDLEDEFSSIVRNDIFYKSIHHGIKRGLSIQLVLYYIILSLIAS
jgi:hypothetical protein